MEEQEGDEEEEEKRMLKYTRFTLAAAVKSISILSFNRLIC